MKAFKINAALLALATVIDSSSINNSLPESSRSFSKSTLNKKQVKVRKKNKQAKKSRKTNNKK